jgi:membrane-bound lytic murein transglycosylase A
VLAWVDDAVGLFFLQIQGSGILTFPGGGARTIGFAASNGHPYVSVGRTLVERGELTLNQASMQGIRAWIEAHPDEGEHLLHTNPRYVFFRELDGPPLGSLGVPVTAGRTVATDPAVFPPGALAFVHVPALGPGRALSRLVLNQDAGAAIRGPGRVDVYFGAGSDAETIAGRLRSPGDLYFFAPRALVTP